MATDNQIVNQNLFVKFVPWDHYTNQNLVHQTIYFSRVYDFNDLNEMHFKVDDSPTSALFYKIINEFLPLMIEHFNYIRNSNLGKYEQNFLERLKHWVFSTDGYLSPNQEIPEDFLPFLKETWAYWCVGIFSISKMDVFTDDAAQLMFAHYAKNLRGLALIYEIENDDLCKIDRYGYQTSDSDTTQEQSQQGSHTAKGLEQRLEHWLDGHFNRFEMTDFLKKSKWWAYEQEYRLFSSPGTRLARNHDVRLKAILHTPRLGDGNPLAKKSILQDLNNINETIYDNTLLIQEINCSYHEYKFVLYADARESIDLQQWLYQKLSATALQA